MVYVPVEVGFQLTPYSIEVLAGTVPVAKPNETTIPEESLIWTMKRVCWDVVWVLVTVDVTTIRMLTLGDATRLPEVSFTSGAVVVTLYVGPGVASVNVATVEIPPEVALTVHVPVGVEGIL